MDLYAAGRPRPYHINVDLQPQNKSQVYENEPVTNTFVDHYTIDSPDSKQQI